MRCVVIVAESSVSAVLLFSSSDHPVCLQRGLRSSSIPSAVDEVNYIR